MCVPTMLGTSFLHPFNLSCKPPIWTGSTHLPSLYASLCRTAWLEKNYSAMWFDAFTNLSSPASLSPQHCLASLTQLQQWPLQMFTTFLYDSIQSQVNNVCFPQRTITSKHQGQYLFMIKSSLPCRVFGTY